uniref:Uncharacterized protein n=1 Tax=Arundo donax TaxID=35708 RepID=A0A0A9EU87_ARUDO
MSSGKMAALLRASCTSLEINLLSLIPRICFRLETRSFTFFCPLDRSLPQLPLPDMLLLFHRSSLHHTHGLADLVCQIFMTARLKVIMAGMLMTLGMVLMKVQ